MILLIKRYRFLVALILFVNLNYFELRADLMHVYENNETLTYEETINSYKELADEFAVAKLMEYGLSDFGEPVHLFVIDFDGEFSADTKKVKILINNGIHAGEPCGIDASLKFAEDVLRDVNGIREKLKNTVICIVPIYNIGGAMNRSPYSRANQNGPKEYGFRGNANNLDLNRDFIKTDSRNTGAFVEIFHFWNPEIFVDTHSSNGADYQHIMTLITTQHDKLNPVLGGYLKNRFTPSLYKRMEPFYKMIPYVYSYGGYGNVPDDGIKSYLEIPRFASGYTALFNCFGFITETLKYKPYVDRVNSTIKFLEIISSYGSENFEMIKELVREANYQDRIADSFEFNYVLDTTEFEMVEFMGYEAKYKKSGFAGKEKLFYDKDSPFTKSIRFYDSYKPSLKIEKPKYYYLSKSEYRVLDLLLMNGVKMEELNVDTVIGAEVYYIDDYKTTKKPYEGHYLHYNVKIRKETQEIKIYRGDFRIEMNQDKNRFVMNVLEPENVDSYFAWNYFDNILQQKEWFSSYVFDDLAVEILDGDEKLRKDFESKMESDSLFSVSMDSQLRYIYKRSVYYEKSHNRYPVFRVVE